MSMSGTEREPESTAPDVSAVTGLRPGESSTSTMQLTVLGLHLSAAANQSLPSPRRPKAKTSLEGENKRTIVGPSATHD